MELAERIKRNIPSIELVRLVNSGTEAVMSAVRAARGFTGRDKIVKLEGCYHGHSDGLLVKGGFMRQKQKNNFSLRLRVVGGNVTAEQIAKELDERYYARELPHKFKFGITGCQNNCLKAEENDLGIKGGIKVSWRESGCIHCVVCLKACRTGALTEQEGKIVLDPEKCNYCGRCVKSCPAESRDSVHGYIVSFGGIFGNQISKGEAIIPFIEEHDKLMAVCDAAIGFFKDHANPGERFKFTIDRVGCSEFERSILKAYDNA